MTGGYIKLHRNLLENPVTNKPEYAWLWCVILLSANHKDNQMIWNGKNITVKEGQFITGRKELSRKSGISESKIYRALKWFENEQQIEQQKTNKYTLITILNWHKYQGNGIAYEQQNEQQMNNKRTTNEQQLNTNKNDKNDKNDKKYISTKVDIVEHGSTTEPIKSKIPVPYEEIAKLFNSICKSLPNLKVLSNSRKNAIRLRWLKYGKKYGMGFYKELFERAEESDFLSGRSGKWLGCNFDWLFKEVNLIKVMEGNYDNR